MYCNFVNRLPCTQSPTSIIKLGLTYFPFIFLGANETNDLPTRRTVGHAFITAKDRDWKAVRAEIIMASTNFLSERLADDQQQTITTVRDLVNARTLHDLLSKGRSACDQLFPGHSKDFADSCAENFESFSNVPHLPPFSDKGCGISTRLRQMVQATSGYLQKLLAAFLVVSPHSMQVERMVSRYNVIRSAHRLSMSNDTVEHQMRIALNGRGTASFNPMPSVARFLKEKERRYREPEPCIYQDRDFISKFFRKDGAC